MAATATTVLMFMVDPPVFLIVTLARVGFDQDALAPRYACCAAELARGAMTGVHRVRDQRRLHAVADAPYDRCERADALDRGIALALAHELAI